MEGMEQPDEDQWSKWSGPAADAAEGPKESFNTRFLSQLFTAGEGARARASNFFPRGRSPFMETKPTRKKRDAQDPKADGAQARTPPPQPRSGSIGEKQQGSRDGWLQGHPA